MLLILRLAKNVLLGGTWSVLPDSPREWPAVFMVPEMHHLTFYCDYHAAIDPSTWIECICRSLEHLIGSATSCLF